MDEAHRFLEIPISDGWFDFSGEMFSQATGFPLIRLETYDAEVGQWMSMLTAGGLHMNVILHPWVIIRPCGMQDHECPSLQEWIDHMMQAREDARRLMNGGAGVVSAGGNGSGNGGARDELNVHDTDSGDEFPDILEVLGLDNPNDSDYVDRGSEADSSESEVEVIIETSVGYETDEDEAMETDDEEDQREVIDLTYLSDD